MAQPPPDQNFYHHTLPHPHSHSHPHSHTHSQHSQLQLPPFELLFDERTGAINFNHIRPYLPNQMPKPDDLSESLIMRRPRRTRTTFTNSQIAELEQHFQQGRYLTAPRLANLSDKLALGAAQIKIWFKNRRRRHKIQSNQHRDLSYDVMLLSPPTPKAEKAMDTDPPNLQALKIRDGPASPRARTPSPTPSTPTRHYSESLNLYHNYNNQHSHVNGQRRNMAQGHRQYSSSMASNAAAQFFHDGAAHQHGNRRVQQLHHSPVSPGRAPTPSPQRPERPQIHHQHLMEKEHLEQYHHFDFQQKSASACRMSRLKIENESNYNFNGSYYMRTTALPLASVAASMAAADAMRSMLSPGSEIYKPLTPKNDESPSLCGSGIGGPCAAAVGADDVTDDMDDGSNKKTKTLQNLEPLKSNNVVTDKASDDGKSVFDRGLLAVARGARFSSSSNGSSAFSKFGKLTIPSAQAATTPKSSLEIMHEMNQYQCTMDTIMQAYNPHRNAIGNTQFAYCFN